MSDEKDSPSDSTTITVPRDLRDRVRVMSFRLSAKHERLVTQAETLAEAMDALEQRENPNPENETR